MMPIDCQENLLPALDVADVVLVRHEKGLFRRWLRSLIDSEWDHVALVIYPHDDAQGVAHTVIAESIGVQRMNGRGSSTVTLHRLDKYLSRPDLYTVGIRRVPGLSPEERRRVAYYLIANIDAPYWPWNEVAVAIAAIFPFMRARVLRTQRFSCSSLIQKAFYDAIDREMRKRIVFKRDTVTPLILQELTNPGDLARTDRMEWIHGTKPL